MIVLCSKCVFIVLLLDPFDIKNADKPILLKISDFDEISPHENTMTMSMMGTVAYMAPEVLETHRFSKSSDVWRWVLKWSF